jgi:hypothetical protein
MDAMTTLTLTYLEPTNPKVRKNLLVPPVGELKGKRIAFVNNGWISFTKIGVHVAEQMLNHHGIGSMPTYQIPPSVAPTPELLDQIASECDAAIVGLANCGSCTSWSVHDATQLVKRGIPAVVVITERFHAVAMATLRSQRMPESIVVEIKGNPEFVTDEELVNVSRKVTDEVVERLSVKH